MAFFIQGLLLVLLSGAHWQLAASASMSGPGRRGTDERSEQFSAFTAKTNSIWSVSCQMRVDAEVDVLAGRDMIEVPFDVVQVHKYQGNCL